MCYIMLYMLELMQKGKHRYEHREQGLHGSTLSAYIHIGIPLRATSLLHKSVVQKPVLQ